MIIDKIENQKIYKSLSTKIKKAFDYLLETDLSQVPLGKYEIDADNIFAIVMEYETKNKSESKFEGHHKYIDLQYIISGTEYIGISTLTDHIPVETNSANDYSLYEIDSDLIKFEAGIFMIFFPDDLHMPGFYLNQISKVRKVVIKIKV